MNFIDYFLKAVGVIALATIAYHTGRISQKVDYLAYKIQDHEQRIRHIESN